MVWYIVNTFTAFDKLDCDKMFGILMDLGLKFIDGIVICNLYEEKENEES